MESVGDNKNEEVGEQKVIQMLKESKKGKSGKQSSKKSQEAVKEKETIIIDSEQEIEVDDKKSRRE